MKPVQCDSGSGLGLPRRNSPLAEVPRQHGAHDLHVDVNASFRATDESAISSWSLYS